MMTMGGSAFIDTNVLLRATHVDVPLHAQTDALVTGVRQDGFELWISHQVIREYMVQVSRPGVLAVPLTAEALSAQVRTMRTIFKIADETSAVNDRLLDLIARFPTQGKQIHDANIVATMLVHGVDTLLTLNTDDMKRFSSIVKIMSPFASGQ